MSSRSRLVDLLRLIPCGGPAVCNISVTNVCNATCDFCNFAHDKDVVTHRSWLDEARFVEAIEVLRDRAGVRYVTFMGGEPLLHPDIGRMARAATAAGIAPTLVTNGWLLPDRLDTLAAAGISMAFISIDSADPTTHEHNRGLKGVCARIRQACARMTERGTTPIASVVMSKLIDDYPALARFLRELGFAAVTFSYPRKLPLGSSSLAWSDSDLVDVSAGDLLAAFEAVDAIRDVIPVLNPRASIDDMKRRLRGEAEHFVCFGGYKYFYLDWKYDLWRCEAWSEPLCSIWEFDATRSVRDGCQACMTDCYRDASVMMHLAVAIGDAFAQLTAGHVAAAVATLADRRVAKALGAVIGQGKHLSPMSGMK
jgi:MoaA/NifB/PqqE/SkfB family radical SAM enzyme